MQYWYEMEGFSADPKIVEVFERHDQKLRELADGNRHDPQIQIVAEAYLAGLAQAEILTQYLQSILKTQGKGKL